MNKSLPLLFLCLFFSRSLFADPIAVPNGDFSSGTNTGTVGGGLVGASGSNVQIGTTGPWVGTYFGVSGLLAPPTLTISSGQATINGLAGAGAVTVTDNGGYFSQTLSMTYAANTLYTLTVDITSTQPITLGFLGTGNAGIAFIGSDGVLASTSTAGASSIAITPINGTTSQVSLQFTTSDTAPLGSIGLELFGQPNGVSTANLSQNVGFANVFLTADVVPEPGSFTYMLCGFALLGVALRMQRIFRT